MFGFTQTNEYDLLDPKACTYVFISVYVCVYCIYFMYFFFLKIILVLYFNRHTNLQTFKLYEARTGNVVARLLPRFNWLQFYLLCFCSVFFF